MFWFFLGAMSGVALYRTIVKRNTHNYDSIVYIESQLAEHEIMLNYYKRLLANKAQPDKPAAVPLVDKPAAVPLVDKPATTTNTTTNTQVDLPPLSFESPIGHLLKRRS